MENNNNNPWDLGYAAYEPGEPHEYAACGVPYDSAVEEEAYCSWWEGWHQAQREYMNAPLSYGEFEQELIDQSSIRESGRPAVCILPGVPGEDPKATIRRTFTDPAGWTRQHAERIGKQAFEKAREDWLAEGRKRQQKD